MTASDPCPLSAFLADRTKIRRHGYFAINVPSVGNPHPEPIELIGGLPNHGFFPVTAARIELRDRPFEAHQKTVVETAVVSNDPDKVDIKTAFQYSNLQGIDPLLGQIKEFVRRVIKPYGQDWEILATAGALNGIARCFDIFVNPGDVVLFEEFTFTPMLRPLADKGGIAVPIPLKGVRGSHNIDYYEELKHLLENWETEKPGLPKPKILYTIPTGHNPLGLSQTVGTKKKIYKLAQEHNFLILEDEPYGYLTFDKVDDESTKYDLSNDEFIDALTPSYISFDTDGRVVRNETFSKIFSPGLRLGFVVINKSFVKQFLLSGEVTIKAPSGYSQLFVNNTIHQLGGIEGWIHWIIQVRNEYLRRKNAFVKSVQATEAAKRGYLDVIDPDCGMFVSIYINVEKHREFNGSNHKQILEQFYIKAAEAGYLAVLGHNMSVDEGYSAPRATFIRNAISYVDSPQVFEEAASRLNTATLALFQ